MQIGGEFDPDMERPYQDIIKATFNLDLEVRFGFHVDREKATQAERIGARAYQRARDRITAEINAEKS